MYKIKVKDVNSFCLSKVLDDRHGCKNHFEN